MNLVSKGGHLFSKGSHLMAGSSCDGCCTTSNCGCDGLGDPAGSVSVTLSIEPCGTIGECTYNTEGDLYGFKIVKWDIGTYCLPFTPVGGYCKWYTYDADSIILEEYNFWTCDPRGLIRTNRYLYVAAFGRGSGLLGEQYPGLAYGIKENIDDVFAPIGLNTSPRFAPGCLFDYSYSDPTGCTAERATTGSASGSVSRGCGLGRPAGSPKIIVPKARLTTENFYTGWNGTALWLELHNRFKHYIDEQSEMYWLMHWERKIACNPCLRHYYSLKAANFPDFSSKKNVFLWGIKLHNLVNRSLNKPEMTPEVAAMTYRYQ